MSFSSVEAGLGQLYTQLHDSNFESLTGGTSIDLGGITGPTGSNVLSGTYSLTSDLGSTIWGLHWDNHFLALVFSQDITSFTISGLDQGISGVFAFDPTTVTHSTETPLPAGLPLFLTGAGLLALLSRYRRHKVRASVMAAAGRTASARPFPRPVSCSRACVLHSAWA
jgi:hypothetical protein